MTRSLLPYQYEAEKTDSTLTGLAGLPLFLDYAFAADLPASIRRHVGIRKHGRGWTDVQVLLSLLLLNLSGGDCVRDLTVLASDPGFRRLFLRIEKRLLTRRERRALERTLRKTGVSVVPSASSVFRYLDAFNDLSQEKLRKPNRAFIPVANRHLHGLAKVNADLLAFVQSRNPQKVATLDQDATLIETSKAEALYCYKHFKAYQPLNTYWAEQGMLLHTEFRDGNVPAGHEQLRVLREALDLLPEGVDEVRLRSDTAGYQHELLRYCARGENPRFGVIHFAVGADVTEEFRKAVSEVPASHWRRLTRDEFGFPAPTRQEYADIPFFPSKSGLNRGEAPYRYIAIREPLEVNPLPGFEEEQQRRLPFQTVELDDVRYKLVGIVTNLDWDDERIIHWYRKRCGKGEEVNAVLKEDFAGGKLPSGSFGENAAWWWIAALSMNLSNGVKQLVLGGRWGKCRMKALRYHLINIPGRVLQRARRLLILLPAAHPSLKVLLRARESLREWLEPLPVPSG